MIFRNSLKNILRTPIKTVFSVLLIAAVTAFLCLSASAWAASVAMLRDSDEACTTIVTMEYLEDAGTYDGFNNEAMLEDLASIDFDEIAANKNVLLWQPSDVTVGIVDGFISHSKSTDESNYCVFIVTGLRRFHENGPLTGTLVESLYSARIYEAGRSIFVYDDPEEGIEFDPDPNATYVIHAYNMGLYSNSLAVRLKRFSSLAAQEAGIDCEAIAPALKISSAAALHADTNNIYEAIAHYYTVINNKLMICRTQEPTELEEFHQGYLSPVSGRLFTGQEAADGAKVCVISETLAKNGELSVGDTLLLRMQEDETASAYVWGDKLTRQESYTVIGIVNYHDDYFLNVYVPCVATSPTPVRFASMLGQATVQNGTAMAFLNEIRPMLPEHVFVNVYDHGYQATANAFNVIRNAAAVLTIIACVLAVVALVLFAYLFAYQQQEPVEIMRSFGVSKTETRLYLLFGATCITFAAIAIGFLMGASFSEKLVDAAYAFVSELQAVDMRYSDGNVGLIKEFTPMATDPLPLSAAVAAAVLVFALFICLYFAGKIINGSLITLKQHVTPRRSPKNSSTAFSGALRHALLPIRRGGVRSFIIPVLCATALLFVASLQSTIASYDAMHEELYESTELNGYCTTISGKYSGGLYLPNEHAIKLVKTDYFENVSFTYRMNYGYLGVTEYVDGSKGQPAPVPNPRDAYTFENQQNKHRTEPYLIFTSSAESAPEFRYHGFHGYFMDGWDEVRFSSREWDKLPCIVSSQFMAQHGIQPGDTIRVYVYYHQNHIMYIDIDMLVVGSFSRVSNQDNIYCPLPLGALDPERSTLNELGGENASPLVTNNYSDRIGDPDMISRLTQQQFLDFLLDLRYVSSLSFTTTQVRALGELKDHLEEMGFSGPKMDGDIRVFVMLEDAQFNETVNSITQRSKYLEMLYPVLLSLVCILALITGFLTVNNRKEDIALMRGMGVSKKCIFGTIFGEQLLLLLFGALPAAVLWLVREGVTQLATLGVYAFFICYALSAAFSTLLQNAKSALSILSENE